MSNSFFYLQIDKNNSNKNIINAFERYSIEEQKQIYIINSPLGDNGNPYGYDQGFVILSPGHKFIFMSPKKCEEFDYYIEDFIQDTGSLTKKYGFIEKVGRTRVWSGNLIYENIFDQDSLDLDVYSIFNDTKIIDKKTLRISDILTSLLTGSINNNENIEMEVNDTVLDKLKQKITLFDGEQTKFIYEVLEKKVTKIQGMSGTGKTELLLHKLKEIYLKNSGNDHKIVITCHNEILAATLKNRIPEFFNFMKVEQQIEWEKKLWCMRAWGSKNNSNSGVYSKICNFYGIEFIRYSYGVEFNYVCSVALKTIRELNLVNIKGFVFDYILVDESQDFDKNFFDLIELVVKEKVYIAGDIFQSIFQMGVETTNPDYLLNKCYRTDPRTLMFSHALGLGLFEDVKLDWLNDEQWNAYGYKIEKNNNQYTLSREKLLKFEDIQDRNHPSVEIVNTKREEGVSSSTKIVEIINKIRLENPTVEIDDIGVVFIANKNEIVISSADELAFEVKSSLGWTVNKAFESRTKIKNTLFVSSKNHVKGLEFPFVICVTNKIYSTLSYRNSLYMMLTRSFLKSYFLINEDHNPGLIEKYTTNLNLINENNSLIVEKPPEHEILKMKSKIRLPKEGTIDLFDLSYLLFDRFNIPRDKRNKLYNLIKQSDANNEIAIIQLIEWSKNNWN